jgi:hypothetical protein
VTDGRVAGEWYSEAFWVLTSRLEPRREPPGIVRVGAAAAALCDLADQGEVAWADASASAALVVHRNCQCADPALRQWHASVGEMAADSRVEARFCLLPLVDRAWDDTAARLTDNGFALANFSRLPWRKPRFQVADQRLAASRAKALASALREGTLTPFDRTLISLAWATDTFDDLFKAHGVTTSPSVTNAARELAAGEEVTGHLETASATSKSTLPSIGGGGPYF